MSIAIFASGKGTNAEKIIRKCGEKVRLVVSNNPASGVTEVAKKYNIPLLIIDKKSFFETEKILARLKEHTIELIVLAGFLWMIPAYLIKAFPKKIINLHPALLPKFGGKGMYGMNVHKAVIESGEKISGITIHYVNENYDEGEIIFQTICEVTAEDTPESLSKKVQELEHKYFPVVVEKIT